MSGRERLLESAGGAGLDAVTTLTRVVIVGGGLSGVSAAQRLERLVLDRNES